MSQTWGELAVRYALYGICISQQMSSRYNVFSFSHVRLIIAQPHFDNHAVTGGKQAAGQSDNQLSY